ncbi:flavocytochrome c [Desulfosediminicola flagellatus]|uniref:flavocytochrome c n=1 Tax=Desulfosediminicola flagellatus TaxID=2569541 RepID=UPI0010ACDAA3|nr:flavocytochrome c [Desulfosediminicola flagellatus]
MRTKKWTEEYDVVIIGSGFAGLAAAIEAKEKGADVVVIEKMRTPGGNSAISGGLFAVAGSPLQTRDGIVDSPDLMHQDMLNAGMNLNHPELAQVVADQSLSALHWSIENLAVQYKENLNHLGGHSVPRTYTTKSGSGSGIIQPMLSKCRQLEIPIKIKTRLNRMISGANDRIEGIEVQSDYHFPHEQSGITQHIRAKKAVVLATGGFGSDVKFRLIQDPRLNNNIDTTNHKGATAEGLIAALEVGATPLQLCWIQLGPWASLDEKGWGVGSLFTLLAGFPYGIMVDAKTGKRFVNEMSDRRLRTDAMLLKDRAPVAIVDSQGVKYATTLDKCLKRGVVQAFDSIEELAKSNMIPEASLIETVRNYNMYLGHGCDTEFEKSLPKDLKPLTTPPYYSIRLLPKVHYCMGGIRINSKAQVLSVSEGLPIPGLYAAGEVTGGIHGASRLGSNSIVECIVFGRIAGVNAVAENENV